MPKFIDGPHRRYRIYWSVGKDFGHFICADFPIPSGKVPFQFLEPVLSKCSADQLLRIEELNEYLVEDTDELWRRHCLQRFYELRQRSLDAIATDSHFDGWRNLYLDLLEREEEKLRKTAEKLRSAYGKIDREKQSRSLVVTDNLPSVRRKRFARPKRPAKSIFTQVMAETKRAINNFKDGPRSSSFDNFKRKSYSNAVVEPMIKRTGRLLIDSSASKPMMTKRKSQLSVDTSLAPSTKSKGSGNSLELISSSSPSSPPLSAAKSSNEGSPPGETLKNGKSKRVYDSIESLFADLDQPRKNKKK